jgi:deoxycytidine triphosphate deaminase
MASYLLDLGPAGSDAEAEARAKQFKQLDPFPDIKPALLSAADIEDYARVTAMLHPFYADPGCLKPASYEVRPRRKFVRWDERGNRIEMDIDENDTFVLLPNTISYIQIEPKIRLPDYIAIRFNLRITHVHRGLLLGTGPLIDPGFSGVPLIPLHNLTSESYQIRADEGLIWVEFTKTAPAVVKPADPSYSRRGSFHPLEASKTDRDIYYYLDRANHLLPIRSSIPETMRTSAENAQEAAVSSKQAATSAERAAESARNAVQSATEASARVFRISIAGAVAVSLAAVGILIALVINLHSYFGQIEANVQTTHALAASVLMSADQVKSDAARGISDEQDLKRDLDAATLQIEDLRGQLANVTRKIETLREPTPATVSPRR